MRLLVLVLVVLTLGLISAPAMASGYSISVKTDQPSYSGTARISINGTISPAPGPNTAAIVVVTNPAGSAVDIEEDAVNPATGNFSQVTVSGPGIYCAGSPCWITGRYVVNATWAGDNATATTIAFFQYQPSSPVTASLSCAPTPFAVGASSKCAATLAVPAGATTDGELVAFSQVGGAGKVAFPSSATCTLSGNSCSIDVTGSSPGEVTVNALYPGDGTYSASNATAIVTVLAATTTSVSCAPSSFTAGGSSTCTARLAEAIGSVAGEDIAFTKAPGSTGNVTIPEPGMCTLGAGGSCSITVAGTSGNATIEAAYPGDASNAASSGDASVTILPPQTTTRSSVSSSTVSSTVSPISVSSTTSRVATSSPTVGTDSTLYLVILGLVAIIVVLTAALWRTAARGKGGAAPVIGNQPAPASFLRPRP